MYHHLLNAIMTTITMSRRELKATVKESIRDVLSQELMNLRALVLPFVSESEQKDIEKHYTKPIRKTVKSRSIRI